MEIDLEIHSGESLEFIKLYVCGHPVINLGSSHRHLDINRVN